MNVETPRTIRYGSAEVPVEVRLWLPYGPADYRKTYRLRPGQRWQDAEVTADQFEHYVDAAGSPIPVGAAIARDLMAEGAIWAFFVELWGGVVIVDADLVCQPLDGPIAEVLTALRDANAGKLGGLPDVLAGYPDGRVAMREAKTPMSGDRLRANQHAMADVARRVLGERLDLAVVEWGGQ